MGRLILRSSVIAGGGGSLIDGGTFTLSGTGFGTNVSASNQEYIRASVEGASNGTSWTSVARAGWTFPGTDAQTVTTNTSLHGTKSLASLSFREADHFQYGSKFDMGGARRVAMFRGAFKVVDSTSATVGQVKLVRVGGGPIASDEGISDVNAPNCYVSRWWSGILSNINVNEASPDSINNTLDPSMGTGNGAQWLEKGTSTGAADWYTIEFVFTAPSAQGVADGAVAWRTINETTGAVKSTGVITGVLMWDTAAATPWQYITLQMYIGNTFPDGTEVYADSHFVITWADSGTTFPKYVLGGNASTFAACTKLVSWKFSTWTNTSITGVPTQGYLSSLAAGNVWGYAMSAPGVPINSSGILPTT